MENISNSYTAQEDRDQKLRISNVIYRAIIVFLSFFIIIVTVLVIGLFKKVSFIPEEISSVIFETVICTHCEDEEEMVEKSSLLKNIGWTYYEYPDLGFSVELPSFSLENKDLAQAPLSNYKWEIYTFNDEVNPPEVFYNYYGGTQISFAPTETEGYDCEEGCLGEAYIYLDYYQNKEKFDIDQVKSEFIKYVTKIQKEMNTENRYNIEMKSIGGAEGFTYDYQAGSLGSNVGYVVLSNDYIVHVKKYVYSKGENLDIVNKVLSSIRYR
ncbi:MAG: hypothetical protein UR61_C0008G0007 [candidate division WS6 bacterium GW2011_GWE1_34_7]|uniref:Uncharacterized protein n=1 Tax=candidate division WS6 bacterium GW2011_GWE1_34_7 TaxID=1619093 RepID=A0A0G0B986_9BACT|nr:MAG: hypothetical protein UR61_C0008G0007 [candidate division WS6 bacterium GW2011_GWE1_34_7]